MLSNSKTKAVFGACASNLKMHQFYYFIRVASEKRGDEMHAKWDRWPSEKRGDEMHAK
jgi:hypothetical protein